MPCILNFNDIMNYKYNHLNKLNNFDDIKELKFQLALLQNNESKLHIEKELKFILIYQVNQFLQRKNYLNIVMVQMNIMNIINNNYKRLISKQFLKIIIIRIFEDP